MFVIDSCSKKLSQPPFGKVPSMSLGNPVGSRTSQLQILVDHQVKPPTTALRVVIPLAGCSPVKDTTLCLFLLVHKVPLLSQDVTQNVDAAPLWRVEPKSFYVSAPPYGGLSLSCPMLVQLPYGGLSPVPPS